MTKNALRAQAYSTLQKGHSKRWLHVPLACCIVFLCLGLFCVPGCRTSQESAPPAVAQSERVTQPALEYRRTQAAPASARKSQRGTAEAEQPDTQAVIIRVTDGDTLLVSIPSFPPILGQNISVRLAGCDTPELKSDNPEVRNKALEAKAMTEALAPPGSTVWLRDIRRDKYFRLLARVEANGVDVAERLLTLGLALPYAGGKKPAHTAGRENP